MGTWSVSLNESYHKEQQYTGFSGFLKYLVLYELDGGGDTPRGPLEHSLLPLNEYELYHINKKNKNTGEINLKNIYMQK